MYFTAVLNVFPTVVSPCPDWGKGQVNNYTCSSAEHEHTYSKIRTCILFYTNGVTTYLTCTCIIMHVHG